MSRTHLPTSRSKDLYADTLSLATLASHRLQDIFYPVNRPSVVRFFRVRQPCLEGVPRLSSSLRLLVHGSCVTAERSNACSVCKPFSKLLNGPSRLLPFRRSVLALPHHRRRSGGNRVQRNDKSAFHDRSPVDAAWWRADREHGLDFQPR
jgi:hypothetical protein